MPSVLKVNEIQSDTSLPLVFNVGNAERGRIDTSGNIGFGITSPVAIGANYTTIDIRGSSGGGLRMGTTSTSYGQLYGNSGGITYDAAGGHFFYTNSIECARINSSGYFLSGVTSSFTNTGLIGQLFAIGSAANNTVLTIESTGTVADSNYAILDFVNRSQVGNDTRMAEIYSSRSNTSTTALNGYLGFATCNSGIISERARFNSTGAFVFAGGTTTADGIGITFPATQSASSNANTLDDYEEGTWTPVIQGGSSAGVSSYTDQQGRYTKIGRQVTVWFFVEVTAATGTGGFQIGGLPFASNGTINQTTGALMTDRLNWTAGSSPVSYLGTGISYLQIYISADDALWSAQQMVNEAFAVLGTHTYFV